MEPTASTRQVNDVLMAPLAPVPLLPVGASGEPAGADGGQHGLAAQAIRAAESKLAGQQSASAQFDRRIIEALRFAHASTVGGRWKLDGLEYEIGAAAANWDLSTSAGTREFQRFLIGKLGQITAVIEEANDDDAAKAALAAALAVLYAGQVDDARRGGAVDSADGGDPSTASAGSGISSAAGFDATAAGRPGPIGHGRSAQFESSPIEEPWAYEPYERYEPLEPLEPLESFGPAQTAYPGPHPASPVGFPGGWPIEPMPALPGGGEPASPWGRALPGGLPADPGIWLDDLAGELDELPDANPVPATDTDPDPDLSDPADVTGQTESARDGGMPPVDATLVRLPGGETVTAASAQLAAVLQSAIDGRSIPEAFAEEGITIPVPGTAVSTPIEVARVSAGDIGMFTDRHALAVGNGKAVLDGQIHYVTNVLGPSFLGWQHPPGLVAGEQRR